MSGENYITSCPRCGGSRFSDYRDWKPYDQVDAICLDCGFKVDTITEIATLLEVNIAREEQEFAPIEELAKPLEDWLKWEYEPVVKKVGVRDETHFVMEGYLDRLIKAIERLTKAIRR